MVILHRLALAFLVFLGLNAAALAGPSIPPLSGRVMDLAHVLDQRTIDALTKQLADHEASTTDQIVVVTLPDLRGDTIEDWGRALLNGWGIGQRDKNNGVVLVVAPNDRRLRIAVGYGLESTLTNGAASGIIENEIVPRFKRNDVNGGITAGVNAIVGTIAGTYRSAPLVERSTSTQRDYSVYMPILVFVLIFFFIVLMVLNRRRDGSTNRRRRYYDRPGYYDNSRSNQDGWGSRSSGFSFGGFSSGRSSGGGGFSGGGGGGGGGGASGRW